METFEEFIDRVQNYDANQREQLKRDLRVQCGQHGLTGVLQALAEMAQELGEGTVEDSPTEPDSWWLEASGHLSRCSVEIRRMVRG